ncbi:MAG: DUF4364 family protein [Clostridia bacterium]|nr:DUF4364 family protein [Clostridia bacterium]
MQLRDKVDVKVFILYLMKNVGEPLEYNTINDIVLQDEFVNYFDFAVAFSELLDAKQIEETGASGVNKLYAITPSGAETLESYESTLLTMIKERALRSALRLLAFNRTGAQIKSTITGQGEGWNLNCRIFDKEKTLFSVDVYLTDRKYAEKMQFNFEERAEIIYRGALALLSGDVNYIFDE